MEQFVTRILTMAVFLIVAESIGTLLGIDTNATFQTIKLVIFCSLLGSAVLALFRPVDTGATAVSCSACCGAGREF